MNQRVSRTLRWHCWIKCRLEERVANLRSQRKSRVSSHEWATDWDVRILKPSEVDRDTFRSEANHWVVKSKQILHWRIHELDTPGYIGIFSPRSGIEQWERVVGSTSVDWSKRRTALAERTQSQDWVWVIELVVCDTAGGTSLRHAGWVPVKKWVREVKLDSFYLRFVRE